MSDHFDYMPKPEGWVSPERKIEDPSPESAQDPGSAATPVESSSKATVEAVADVPADTEAERVVTIFSNILSWIFVPLLMPVYGIILIFSLSILSMAAVNTKLIFTMIVLGVNFVVPMIGVLLLKKMGVVQDLGLYGRGERTIPYIITTLCLAGTGFFLYMKGAPVWVARFYTGGALASLINFLVNFRWKISAHAAGMAGIVAMLIQIMKEGSPSGDITLWIAASILLCGLLCSARVWLGRHTLMQVLAGSAVGFLCVWTLSLFC